MIRTQERSVLCVCIKFEALFVQKLLGGNLEIGLRDLSHAPFELETLNLCRHPSSHIGSQILLLV